MARSAWIDLLDPEEEELRSHVDRELDPHIVELLLRPAEADGGRVRPSIKSHGDYVLGLLLVAVVVPEEDRLFYQEVDFVLTHDRIVTVRKTPPGAQPFDAAAIREVCDARPAEVPPGSIAHTLVDEIAERFLDLVDSLDEEINELEDHADEWPAERTRRRVSELRHDLLHLRKTLAPTRDAVREVVDGRVELEKRMFFTREVFPPEVERQFASVYDKLLRASEATEYARDLLGAVRDYQQARVSIDQNEVTKRLTAIAAILLVPTFIVGLYGQNFRDIPELDWSFGYWWSWGWIIVLTVFQIVYFRRKRWL